MAIKSCDNPTSQTELRSTFFDSQPFFQEAERPRGTRPWRDGDKDEYSIHCCERGVALQQMRRTRFPPKKNGLEINMTYANDQSRAKMVSVVVNMYKDQLTDEFRRTNYISVMADCKTDTGGLKNDHVRSFHTWTQASESLSCTKS